MGKDKKTPITINGTEYQYEDLNSNQQSWFNHIVDLERKIANSRFNLDQLQVGHGAFLRALTESLQEDPVVEEFEEVDE